MSRKILLIVIPFLLIAGSVQAGFLDFLFGPPGEDTTLGATLGATVCFPQDGCTGTSTIPTADQILIGGDNSRYDVKTLLAGSNITISTSSSQVTISSSASSDVSVFGDLSDVSTSSDATGDIYYLNSSGQITNLGVGSAGEVLKVSGGLPSWGTDSTGAGGDPGLIVESIGGDAVFTASSTAGSYYLFEEGFVSQASSTIASTLEVTGNLTLDSSIIIGGDTISDFAGTGLTVSGGNLTADLGTSVDISDETNAAATWPITLTDDTFGFDGLSTTSPFTTGNIVEVASNGSVTSTSTISDFVISDALTISGSGSVTWSALTSYPTGCTNQFVRSIGDTLTCESVVSADITDGTIVNADINASAAIAYSKLNLSDSVVEGDLGINAPTDGNILVASSSATGAMEWTATTSPNLGLVQFSDLHDAVTLAGSLDYLTISGQEITRNAIDLTTDTTGTLAVGDGGTGQTSLSDIVGTTNQISVAAGANTIIGGDATLSIPSYFDITDINALNATTTNATTTSLYIQGLSQVPLYVDSSGQVISAGTGTSGNCVEWGANNTLADSGAGCGGGSSEWTDGGSFLRPSEATDQVYVGTSTDHTTSVTSLIVSATSTDTTKLVSFLNDTDAEVGSLTDEGLLTVAGDVDIGASQSYTVNGTGILVDSAGTLTLSNIDAIDATTETTFEDAIDSLANLTTTGTLTSGATGAGFTVNLDSSTVTCTDCIDDTDIDWGTGANQVSVADLTGDQVFGSVVIDAGGATSLEIPNAASPTVDAAGEIALDTTDNQLLVADSGNTARVMGKAVDTIWAVTVASTTPEFISGGLLPVPVELDGYTIVDIRCKVDGGTSKVIAVEDASANSTEDITCATTVTADDGSITNATATAEEEMYIDFGATTGSVNYVSISVYGYWTRE